MMRTDWRERGIVRGGKISPSFPHIIISPFFVRSSPHHPPFSRFARTRHERERTRNRDSMERKATEKVEGNRQEWEREGVVPLSPFFSRFLPTVFPIGAFRPRLAFFPKLRGFLLLWVFSRRERSWRIGVPGIDGHATASGVFASLFTECFSLFDRSSFFAIGRVPTYSDLGGVHLLFSSSICGNKQIYSRGRKKRVAPFFLSLLLLARSGVGG